MDFDPRNLSRRLRAAIGTATACAAQTERVMNQRIRLHGEIPVREFRSNLAEVLSDVADRRDHVVVTRNGRPAAALVPVDEYQALEETAEILSDTAPLDAIHAGLDELARGETVDLDALRRELAEKRAAS